MTGKEFSSWIAEMKYRQYAKSDADCARQLGVTPRSVLNWKETGTPSIVYDLACAALLVPLGKYGGEGEV